MSHAPATSKYASSTRSSLSCSEKEAGRTALPGRVASMPWPHPKSSYLPGRAIWFVPSKAVRSGSMAARASFHGRNSNQTRPGGPGSYPQSSAMLSTRCSPNPPTRSASTLGGMTRTWLAGVRCSIATRTWSSSASITIRTTSCSGTNPACRTALAAISLIARRASSHRPSRAGGGMASFSAARARKGALGSAGRITSLRRIGAPSPA